MRNEHLLHVIKWSFGKVSVEKKYDLLILWVYRILLYSRPYCEIHFMVLSEVAFQEQIKTMKD